MTQALHYTLRKGKKVRILGMVNKEKQAEYDRNYYVAHKDEKAEYHASHRDERNEYSRKYYVAHKDEIKERHRSYGALHKVEILENNRTGLRGERGRIRCKHNHFKPYCWLKEGLRLQGYEPQIHHEWIPTTSEYTGVALVEADDHRSGIINPLIILDGKVEISGCERNQGLSWRISKYE